MVTGPKDFVVSGEDLFRMDSGDWHRLLNAPLHVVALTYGSPDGGKTSEIFAFTSYNEVYASYDLGTTWIKKNSSGSTINGSINSATAAPSQSGPTSIFLASEFGIFRSSDDGTSWQKVNTGLSGESLLVYEIAAQTTNHIIAATNAGMYVSDDGGTTWHESDQGIQFTIYPLHNMAHVAINGNDIYASTVDVHGTQFRGQGIYRSTDGGTSWSIIDNGLGDSTITGFAFWGSSVFAATLKGIYKSDNRGASWQLYYDFKSPINFILVSGGRFCAGTSTGIYSRSDPTETVSWDYLSGGLSAGYATVGALYIADSTILAGTGERLAASLDASGGAGAFYSHDNGKHWRTAVGTNSHSVVNCFAKQDSFLFASTISQLILRSSDNGSTWTPCNNGLPEYDSNATSVGVLGSDLYASLAYPFHYACVSKDHGDTWHVSSLGDVTNYPDMLCYATDSVAWYAGGVDGMFRSTNNGQKWSRCDSGLFAYPPPEIAALQVTPVGVYSQSWDGLFRSLDHGLSWHRVDSAILPSLNRRGGALAYSNGHLFLGRFDGVFLFDEATEQWKYVSDGFFSGPYARYVESLAIIGDTLFAGLLDEGIWFRSITEMINEPGLGVSEQQHAPPTIDAYPNPASNSITVCTRSKENMSAVVLMNELGETVRTSVSHDARITLDVASLPGGVYNCVAEYGGQRSAIKVVVHH